MLINISMQNILESIIQVYIEPLTPSLTNFSIKTKVIITTLYTIFTITMFSSKDQYNSPSYTLPLDNLPYIFQGGLFTRELNPIIENKE